MQWDNMVHEELVWQSDVVGFCCSGGAMIALMQAFWGMSPRVYWGGKGLG